MKITSFSFSLFFLLITLSKLSFSQIPLNPNYNFSNDKEPSEKKLKEKIKLSNQNEANEYCFYLYNHLLEKAKKESDLNKGNRSSEEIKIKKQIAKLVAENLLGEATNGNVRAIGVLASFLNYCVPDDQNCPLILKTFQMSIGDLNKVKINYIDDYYFYFQLKNDLNDNDYSKARVLQDTLITKYFDKYTSSRLAEIKIVLVDKLAEIRKLQIKSSYGDFSFPKTVKQNDLTNISLPDFEVKFAYLNSTEDWYPYRFSIRTFYDGIIKIPADQYLEILLSVIDNKLSFTDSESLAKTLKSMLNSGNQSKQLDVDFTLPKNQFFANDKNFGPEIFKLLSGLVELDMTEKALSKKTYFLNRAAELGSTNSYFNIACLYNFYYKKTGLSVYNDSCIKYIEKGIGYNLSGLYTLKGIKVFNGEGYIQNKSDGIALITKGKNLGSSSADNLLDKLPKELFSGVREGYYYNPYVKIEYPWDFKVLCSNGCGKRTFPKKIEYCNLYTSDNNIKGVAYYVDDCGNASISISEADFKKTFTIVNIGIVNNEYYYFKHTMCSGTCQLAHENRNNQNWEAIKIKREQIDNEEIKCVGCNKVQKRKDMISVVDCPCLTDKGTTMNISFTQSLDIYGDNEPKACSSECQINFCKTKCASKGYSSKY